MMTVSEFAQATGRSQELVRRWLRQGRLPGVKATNGEWLVDTDGAIRGITAIQRSRRTRRPTLVEEWDAAPIIVSDEPVGGFVRRLTRLLGSREGSRQP